ncbi:hypothetical protein [Sinorhizobium meliloti]|uniref:hypothetical protein n=1 Tax=Rhizobium meliloti TaxID=382 RepID=UPI000FD70CF5|nr:hypothetical protein [Sinorhizobium meliloti]RVE81623.1 hypothetical protein CN238_29315 [Sinorhizobium meliloti]RVH22838.1 hypothetical protein CN214_28880 [Sinorhizobium meliloti]
MAKLDVDQYVAAVAARLAHLTQTYAIVFFASIATMFAILAYASSAGLAARIALATIVVANTVYGVLAAKSALDDLKAMLDDAVDDFSGSSFGAHLKQIPMKLFTRISDVLVLAMGVTQLWAIISA